MAIVNVAEFATVTNNPSGPLQIVQGPPLAVYDVAVTGASVAGQAFNAATKIVRLCSDTTCRVRMDTANNCSAADARFAGNQTEYWGVSGTGQFISCITST